LLIVGSNSSLPPRDSWRDIDFCRFVFVTKFETVCDFVSKITVTAENGYSCRYEICRIDRQCDWNHAIKLKFLASHCWCVCLSINCYIVLRADLLPAPQVCRFSHFYLLLRRLPPVGGYCFMCGTCGLIHPSVGLSLRIFWFTSGEDENVPRWYLCHSAACRRLWSFRKRSFIGPNSTAIYCTTVP